MKIRINDLPPKEIHMFSTGLALNMESTKNDEYGTLKLVQIKNIDDIDPITSVTLLSDDNQISIEFDKISMNERCGNLTDIFISVKDVFYVHKEILKILKFDYVLKSKLCCYNLPQLCNLQCSYCAQHDKHDIIYSFDHYLNSIYITKEHEVFDDVFDMKFSSKAYDRYMGGETLLNWKEFEYTTNFYMNKYHDKSDNMELYTNLTIPNSIKKLKEWIESTSKYKFHDLWFTIDTLNLHNSLRFTSKHHISAVKCNIDDLKDMLSFKNVKINFNLMYINSDITLSMAKWLHDQGFKYFKLATNECDYSEEYSVIKYTDARKCFIECCRFLTPSTKMFHENTFPYFFSIVELSNNAYTVKYGFESQYNHIEIYQPYYK